MSTLLRHLTLAMLLGLLPAGVLAQCDSSFTFVTGLCSDDPVAFTSNANPADVDTYFWTFGDGNTSDDANPVHTYNFSPNGATYNVTLTVTLDDSAGTTCTSNQLVTVNGGPLIVVSVDSPQKCIQNLSDSVTFSPTFTIDPIYAGLGPFTWDFGNGTVITSPALSQTILYDCFGNFPVTVTANGATCPSFSQNIRFFTNPVASTQIIGSPVVCEGDTIEVANNTDIKCGNVEYFTWNWGDGAPYNVSDTARQFYTYDLGTLPDPPFPGGSPEQVQLIAGNACFTHFNISQITVNPGPRAGFDAVDTVCMPTAIVNFTNTTNPDEFYFTDPSSYVWDFGDGSPTSTLADPVHDYSAAGPGVYTVTLAASNNCGTSVVTRDVVVVGLPIADFVLDTLQGCAPVCVDLTNNSTPDTLDAQMFWNWQVLSDSAWTFAGGSGANDFAPTFCFGAPDTFGIVLEARNLCGMDYDTSFLNINISPFIVLDTVVDSCGVFVLDSLGYVLEDYGSPISQYTWVTTGVPDTAFGPTLPPITFAGGQTHTITLLVENSCGITSASTSFTIDPQPLVDGGADTTLCVNDPGFTLTATPDTGFWTGIGVDPLGNFLPTGVDTFTLVYTHFAPLCLAYDTVMIMVTDTPAVVARADTAFCLDSSVVVNLTATPAGGTWFAPAGVALINGNQFRGDTAGSFVFTYLYSDSTGCEGSDNVVVTVNGLADIDVIDTTFYCLTNTAQPLPIPTVVSPAGGTGIWTGPGVSNGNPGEFTPSVLGGPDTVTVFYTFTTDSGCVSIDSVVIEVISADSVAAGPLDTLCFNVGLDTLTGFFSQWGRLGRDRHHRYEQRDQYPRHECGGQ